MCLYGHFRTWSAGLGRPGSPFLFYSLLTRAEISQLSRATPGRTFFIVKLARPLKTKNTGICILKCANRLDYERSLENRRKVGGKCIIYVGLFLID